MLTRRVVEVVAEEIALIHDYVPRTLAAEAAVRAFKRLSPSLDTEKFYKACRLAVTSAPEDDDESDTQRTPRRAR